MDIITRAVLTMMIGTQAQKLAIKGKFMKLSPEFFSNVANEAMLNAILNHDHQGVSLAIEQGCDTSGTFGEHQTFLSLAAGCLNVKAVEILNLYDVPLSNPFNPSAEKKLLHGLYYAHSEICRQRQAYIAQIEQIGFEDDEASLLHKETIDAQRDAVFYVMKTILNLRQREITESIYAKGQEHALVWQAAKHISAAEKASIQNMSLGVDVEQAMAYQSRYGGKPKI